MRDLSTLRMPSTEIFARVLEGMCPGCGRALERRTVNPDRLMADAGHRPRECGWCTLCEWGWSAWTYRGEPGQWQPGEHLTTVFAEGALMTSNVEPRTGEDFVTGIVEDDPVGDFGRARLDRWS